MKHGNKKIPDGYYFLLRELVVENGGVPTDDQSGGDECQTSVSEGNGGLSKGEGFKIEVDKRGEGVYADVRSDRGGLRREEIVEEGEMGVRIGTKVAVCGDEVGEENVLVVTDATSLTCKEKKVDGRTGKEEVAEMGFHWRVGLEQSTALIAYAVCGGSALGGLAILCLEEDLRMFVDACVTGGKSSDAADVIDDVVKRMELESL